MVAVLADVPGGEPILLPSESFPAVLRSALAPNGNLLAATDHIGEVALWDRLQQQFRPLGVGAGFATVLSFSPDGLRLAVGYLSGNLVVYNPHTGESDGPSLRIPQPEDITFSPDGKLLAGATGNEVVLWDAATRERVAAFRTGKVFIRRLVFHPGGQFLATAGDSPTLSLWDTQGRSRGAFNWEIGKVQAVAFAPDGMTATAGGSSGKLAIWDVEDGMQ
jgi:WD40 repeat protein